ncbi:MAG TPA: type II toxin-antitoxin system VapC family toxin [Caulobacteraceae bacterium]|nr:type II toxin-antitoxin system VapC family toxin [Caulobacteraceae bacterium]
MKALLDTNIVIDFLNGVEDARDEFARYDDLAISVITWMEVLAGAAEETAAMTRRFLSRFTLIRLDEDVAERAVELRRSNRIKLPDAIVWASALRDARLLITRDVRAFPADDPGVRVPYRL